MWQVLATPIENSTHEETIKEKKILLHKYLYIINIHKHKRELDK